MSKAAVLSEMAADCKPFAQAIRSISSEQSAQLSQRRQRSTASGRGRSLSWQEGFASGQAGGHEQGYQAGMHEALNIESARYEGEIRTFASVLNAKAAELNDAFEGFKVKLESDLAALAVVIAGRIVHEELRLDRESIIAIVKATFQEAMNPGTLRIRLNPFDAAIVESHQAELISANATLQRIEITPDPTILGGCVVETEGGAVDATVQTMLERLVVCAKENS